MLLPDINVWLALTFGTHVHHPAAKIWFDALSGDVCCFCRLTQQGFLRLATNHKVFGAQALTLRQAWQAYDTLQTDPRVSFADEPPNLESQWRAWTLNQWFSPNVWSDAYLAAFAHVGGYEIITFDQGFSKYAGLKCTILP